MPTTRRNDSVIWITERNFLPAVTRDMDFDQIRCMAVMRVWRKRPTDGNVELMVRKTSSIQVSSLNGTGSFLWELAQDHPTLRELIDRLAERYELPPERAAEDALAFVNQMMAAEHMRAILQ